MARRAAVLRAQPCALAAAAAAAALALACALYYAGSGPARPGPPPPARPRPPVPSPPGPAPESKAKAGEELLRAEAAELHVLAVLAKAERNEALLAKAAAALRSLVRFGKLGPREALALHLLCDGPSRSPARQLLQQALRPAAFKYKVGRGGRRARPLASPPPALRRPVNRLRGGFSRVREGGAPSASVLAAASGQVGSAGSRLAASTGGEFGLWWEGGSGSPRPGSLGRTGGAPPPGTSLGLPFPFPPSPSRSVAACSLTDIWAVPKEAWGHPVGDPPCPESPSALRRWSSTTWRRWPRSCSPRWRPCSSSSARGRAATTGTRSSSSRSPCTVSCPERFHGSYRWTWMWNTEPTSGNCFRNLTTSQKERLSASPEKCSQSIGTSSGSIGRNIPGPRWGSRLRTGCLASTAGCCFWTWRPCASRSATTVCWSRWWCSSWPASSTSRATWGTRTSSPWWAWSTQSSSTSWTVPGTASSAPGGATTATATSLSTTSAATATSASTTGTATRPSRQSSGCLGSGGGGLPRNSPAAAQAVCPGVAVGRALLPPTEGATAWPSDWGGGDAGQKGPCGGVSCPWDDRGWASWAWRRDRWASCSERPRGGAPAPLSRLVLSHPLLEPA